LIWEKKTKTKAKKRKKNKKDKANLKKLLVFTPQKLLTLIIYTISGRIGVTGRPGEKFGLKAKEVKTRKK